MPARWSLGGLNMMWEENFLFVGSIILGSYENVMVFLSGAGDDTRAWGPPFAGAESVYFLSVNRNKKVNGVWYWTLA